MWTAVTVIGPLGRVTFSIYSLVCMVEEGGSHPLCIAQRHSFEWVGVFKGESTASLLLTTASNADMPAQMYTVYACYYMGHLQRLCCQLCVELTCNHKPAFCLPRCKVALKMWYSVPLLWAFFQIGKQNGFNSYWSTNAAL